MTASSSAWSADDLLPLSLGPRETLVATTAGDAEDAFAVIEGETERLAEFFPWVTPTVSAATEREFLTTLQVANATGVGLHATIRVDDEFAGLISLRLEPLRPTGELGYWLAERHVGRGLMTRAAAALTELAFRRMGLHRVQLLAASDNPRSRAIAERLGMRHEGTMREAEELRRGFVDLELYGVLVQDWATAASKVKS